MAEEAFLRSVVPAVFPMGYGLAEFFIIKNIYELVAGIKVPFVFCTDMLGNALYAPLVGDADVKTMIFKNFSWRVVGFVCGHEELLDLFGESDTCLSNTVDVRILTK